MVISVRLIVRARDMAQAEFAATAQPECIAA